MERIATARGLGSLLLPEAEVAESDPMLLQQMDRALELIREACQSRGRIAIYGDYDADGVTATALLVGGLRGLGPEPLAYIPDRQSEGYGLHQEALRELHARGATLVITVDCGTSAVEVARERPSDLRLVITDHHLPHLGETGQLELPKVDALINPRVPQDSYPFKGLAGVGVAYQLLRALELQGMLPAGGASRQLPLVALGTVADMMPLQDENRRLVQGGLRVWSEFAPPGLRLLAGAGSVTSQDLAFRLAPRINAAGRMGDARPALDCCLADDESKARAAVARLEELNRARKESLTRALAQARAQAALLPEELPLLFLGSADFHPGVVGLVAGRLVEEFGRPAFVFSRQGDGAWRGSARGVAGLNVVAALAACADQLLTFGGHLSAGGFSLAPSEDSVAALARELELAVTKQLGGRSPVRTFQVDAEVRLGQCDLELADQLLRLQPCGSGNPQALLCASGLRVEATRSLGAGGNHLKVILQDGTGTAEAITFNRPHLRRHLPEGRLVDAIFELEVDCWLGRRRPRLLLRDLRPARS